MDNSRPLDDAAVTESSNTGGVKIVAQKEPTKANQGPEVKEGSDTQHSTLPFTSLSNTVTQKPAEAIPSTSTVAPNVFTTASTSANRVGEEEDEINIESSNDEDDDVHATRFSRYDIDGNTASIEDILKENQKYLAQRCSSLMQRVQGIMQDVTATHVSRQLNAVLEHPGLNPLIESKSKGNSQRKHIPPVQRLTKQNIAELQFAGKAMKNIIRQAMGTPLDLKDDSATDESGAEDDEVVLPDDKMTQNLSNSESTPAYLPV